MISCLSNFTLSCFALKPSQTRHDADSFNSFTLCILTNSSKLTRTVHALCSCITYRLLS